MKKFGIIVVVLCVAMFCFTTGCTDNKGEGADSASTDSTAAMMADTTMVDSVVESAPMPKAADKLFADFFFDFISKKKVQMARVQFPLKTVDANGKVGSIARGAWKMERFYQNQEYYTQIFDSEKQKASVAKTKADTVVVEKIHLKQGVVNQYVFNHPEGKWVLAELRSVGLKQSKNASFLAFLQRFFTDKAFQMKNVKSPLPYYGPDPNGEEEDKYINTKIPASTWTEYVPEIPKDQIYNILYGQKYEEGNEKIFLFKGIANGLETELKFKKQGGRWMLVKMSL